MTLADLDRVIEAMGDFVASYCALTKSDAYQPTDEWEKADTDVVRASKAVALLRTMRDNAVEGLVDAEPERRPGFTMRGFAEGGTPDKHPHMRSALLLITPEDDG